MDNKTEPRPQGSDRPVDVLILAAGLGTRMRSRTAKVLHRLGGHPLVVYACRTAATLSPRHTYVVVGHQADKVAEVVSAELGHGAATFVEQTVQRGTGDAVNSAREVIAHKDSTLLVLSGDVPLVRAETLQSLIDAHRETGAACTMLSVRLEDPKGYGRVVRDASGNFSKIVEDRDATAEERLIDEINTGIYCFESEPLFRTLKNIKPANAQGEYYLTDVLGILVAEGAKVGVLLHDDAREVSGVNTRAELAEFERLLRERTLERLMTERGVTIIDPAHTYVDANVEVGRDTILHPDVHIEGTSVIGEDCEIRSGTRITNSRIGNGVTVKDHCVVVDSDVADGCSLGPFAHLRMNSRLEPGAVVGNFVEMKKSLLGRKSKSMHLTYLGDAIIGEGTNIGAGTITCNYDGKHKHQTVIEDHVKIGSDTMLVAPIRVGRGSVTAAGAVVTEDVPPNTLVAGVPARVKKHLTTGKDEEREEQ